MSNGFLKFNLIESIKQETHTSLENWEPNWDVWVEERILVWTLSTKMESRKLGMPGPVPHPICYIYGQPLKVSNANTQPILAKTDLTSKFWSSLYLSWIFFIFGDYPGP